MTLKQRNVLNISRKENNENQDFWGMVKKSVMDIRDVHGLDVQGIGVFTITSYTLEKGKESQGGIYPSSVFHLGKTTKQGFS